MAQSVKILPAMQENPTWVQSLGREDPLEKEMATHSSILAWEIPWTEEPGGLQSMGSQGVRHDRVYFTAREIFSLLKSNREVGTGSILILSFPWNGLSF